MCTVVFNMMPLMLEKKFEDVMSLSILMFEGPVSNHAY